MPLTQFQILNEALSRKCLTTLDIVFQFCHIHTAGIKCTFQHFLSVNMPISCCSLWTMQILYYKFGWLIIIIINIPKLGLFSVKSATNLFKNIHQSPYTIFSIAMHFKGEGGEIWFVTSSVFHSREHNIHAGTKLVLARMLLHSGFQHHNFKTICYSLPGQRLFRMKQT
jgi:hypothetical protein